MRPDPNNTSWLTAFLCWMRRHTTLITVVLIVGVLLQDLPARPARAARVRPAAAARPAGLLPADWSLQNTSFETWTNDGAPAAWSVSGGVAPVRPGLNGSATGLSLDLGSSVQQSAVQPVGQVTVALSIFLDTGAAQALSARPAQAGIGLPATYPLVTITVNGSACAFKATGSVRQVSCSGTVASGARLDVTVARDSGAAGLVVVDQLSASGSSPTATPSPTPTSTPTASPTPTSTPTVTPSPTPTMTPSVTPTSAALPSGVQNPGFEQWAGGQPVGWSVRGTVQQWSAAPPQTGSAAALSAASSLAQRFALPSGPTTVYVQASRYDSGPIRDVAAGPPLTIVIGNQDCTAMVLSAVELSCAAILPDGVAELTLARGDTGGSLVLLDDLRVVSGDSAPPSAPANLRLTDRGDTSLGLAWDPSSDTFGVESYEIAANGQPAGTAAGTSFTLTGLTRDSEYSLTVTARDAAGNRSAPSAPLAVRTLSARPLAASTTLTTSEDVALAYDLSQLLALPPGATPALALGAAPQHGAASLIGTTLLYTPTADYFGADALTYRVQDGLGGAAEGRIALALLAVNDPPAFTLDAFPRSGLAPLNVSFSVSASDAENDPLTYTWDFGDGQTDSGAASVRHSYYPSGGYVARLTVDDGRGGRVSELVEINTVDRSGNGPPHAGDGALVWDPASATGALDLNTIASDSGSLRFSLVETPTLGTAVLSGSLLTYDATGVYTGTAQVRYQADDGRGGRSQGTVRISRADLLPEGNVVVGLDGLALGAATGVVTAPLRVSVAAEPSLPAELPADFVQRGGGYRLILPGDARIDGSQRPLLVGLPVPAGVPTDSLALAVYTPSSDVTDGAAPGPWMLRLGDYNAAHRLYVGQLPYLAQDRVVVTLVSTRFYEPLVQTLYRADPPAQPRGPLTLAAPLQQTWAIPPFVIAYAAPHKKTDPLPAPEALVRAYAEHIRAAYEWYHANGFAQPNIHRVSAGAFPANTLLPVGSAQGGQLYDVFELLPGPADMLLGEGDCATGQVLGSYNIETKVLLLCYTPNSTVISDQAKRTMVHEMGHAVQFANPDLQKPKKDVDLANDGTRYFFEGTASLIQGTWPGKVPTRFDPRGIRPIGAGLAQTVGSKQLVYQTQDFWMYYLQKYGNNDIGGLASLFAHSKIVVSGGRAQMDYQDHAERLYWEWLRIYSYERWSYLNATLKDGVCKPNTATMVEGVLLTLEGGQTVSQVPRINLENDQGATFTVANPTPGMAGWLIPVPIHKSAGLRSLRVSAAAPNSAALRAAFYTPGAGCAAGDTPALSRVFDLKDIPGDDFTLWVLVADVAYDPMPRDAIRISVEPGPTPVDDDRTGVEITPGTPVELLDLLDNDRPAARRADLRVADVKALNLDDKVEILPGERGVRYTPPTVVYTEECDNPDEVKPRNTAFLYWNRYSDGSARSAAFARVSVRVRAKCLYAAPDTASSDSGKPVTVDVLANDKYPKTRPVTVEITSSPARGRVRKIGETIEYTSDPITNCTGADEQDVFNYRFVAGQVPDIQPSNVTTVTVTLKTKANPAVCTSGGQVVKILPYSPQVRDQQLRVFAYALMGVAAAGVICGLLAELCAAGMIAAAVGLAVLALAFAVMVIPKTAAVVNGDPHIVTFDGLASSPQTLGEFTYAAAPPMLRVQARHQTLPGFAEWSSFVSAAAVGAGANRFEVRLPASGLLKDPLQLLVNGSAVSVPAGLYPFGDALLWVEPGNEVTIFAAEGGLATAQRPDQVYSVRIGKYADSAVVRTDTAVRAAGLRVEVSAPRSSALRGLLGTPDGDSTNDLLIDNHPAQDYAAFTEHWRVKTRAESLFTYGDSESPDVFNREQTLAPPAGAALEPHLLQIRSLLTDSCGLTPAQLAQLDPVIIRNMAYDFAARVLVSSPAQTESELIAEARAMLIARGLCAEASGYLAAETASEPTGVVISGRVTLEGQPEVGLDGARVRVSAPALGGLLCDTTTLAGGQFGCSAPTASITTTESIDLVYLISGFGQSVQRTYRVPAPRSGAPLVEQRFFSAPAERVLHLSGRVSDPAGLPLAGALVQVSGPQRLWTLASAEGDYALDYPLPNGMTRAALRYEAFDPAGASYAAEDALFQTDAATRGVLPLVRNLATRRGSPPPSDGGQTPAAARRFVLVGGLVTDALVADRPVPVAGVRVQLSGPQLSRPCATLTDAGGFYQCDADLLADPSGALELTLTFSGAGAPQTRALSIPAAELPAPGAAGAVVRLVDIGLPAATLNLEGLVTLAGAAQSDALVEVSHAAAGLRVSGKTDQNGRYRLSLALADQAVASGQVELTYLAAVDTLGGTRTISEAATLGGLQPGQARSVPHDLALTDQMRAVVFTGQITNSRVPAAYGVVAVPGARVQLSSPAKGALCDVRSDASGFYRCVVFVRDSAPFAVVYQISGRGGLTSPPVQIDPAQSQLRSFGVAPLTLEVSGHVADPGGQTRAGVRVGLEAAGQSVQVQTLADGSYRAYLALPDSAAGGTLALSAYYQEGRVTRAAAGAAALPASLSGLVPVPAPALTLSGPFPDPAQTAALRLRGTLRDRHEPQADMSGLTLVLSAAPYGELCRTTSGPGGAYDCPAPLTLPAGPLALRYLLPGYTSAEGASITLEPGANDGPFDLEASPTTLVAAGQVRSRTGQALANVPLSFSGAFVGGTTSDAQGQYRYAHPLPLTAFQGTLTTSARFGAETASAEQSYLGAAGQPIGLEPLALTRPQPLLVAPAAPSFALDAGRADDLDLPIRNSGDRPLHATLSVADAGSPAWLSLSGPDTASLAPGAEQPFRLHLDATALISGTYDARLALHSDDPDHPLVELAVRLRVRGTPELALEPAVLDFGSVYITQRAVQTLTIRNPGSADLKVTFASPPAGWVEVPAGALTVPPRTARTVQIAVTPPALTSLPVTLSLVTNTSAGAASLRLTGQVQNPPGIGLTPMSPISATRVSGSGLTSERTLQIRNDGSSTLNWSLSQVVALETVAARLDAGLETIRGAITQRYDFSPASCGNCIMDSALYNFGGNILNTNYWDIGYSDAPTPGQYVSQYPFGGGRYFTRLHAGLFVLAADLNQVSWFKISDPPAARDAGSEDASVLHITVNNTPYLGFVYRSYAGVKNGVALPSLNHLVIVEDRPGIDHAHGTNAGDKEHIVSGLGGAPRLYYLLYAGQSGRYINDSETRTIMETFLGVVGQGDVVRASPAQGQLAPGASQSVDLLLGAGALPSGSYPLKLTLFSDDLVHPRIDLPISLTVTPPPQQAPGEPLQPL